MSARAREFYDRVAPWVTLVTLFIAAAGIWVGASATITNARQDAASRAERDVRDEQQRALLDCFDQFASQLAGGLPPVREATSERDNELGSALESLELGLRKVGQQTFEPSDLERIVDEFASYQRANRLLAQVRKDNPYPPPPSTFCSTR